MAVAMSTGTGQAVASTVDFVPLQPTLASYAYAKDEPGEAVFANIAGAVDQPNTIRYAVSSVADVFKNAPCSPIAGQSVNGLSILVQVNEVWKVADAANTSFDVRYLPVSAHMVLKLPVDEFVTAANACALIARLSGAPMRAAGDIMTVGVGSLLHGVTRL